MVKRTYIENDGLELSYLDWSGTGEPLIALHAHWMEAAMYTTLATDLASGWRIIALDQRRHGYSDHAKSYSRGDYLGDLQALFKQLGIEKAVLVAIHSEG